MSRRAHVAVFILGCLLFIAGAGTTAFFRDMNQAKERVLGKSKVIASHHGAIEYTEGGSGPAVLVIHGSGGGYDQGELIAQTVLGDQFYRITPSRFGYLASALPPGATWDEQAHAYAYLLDHLEIEQVAVVAMSQGGPSALLFALLHPERVASLTLISCGVTATSDAAQLKANAKGDMLKTIFSHDPLYWLMSRVFRKQLMALIGADESVIKGLTSDQRKLFDRFIDEMNPVSLRSEGVAFDNHAKLPGGRIAAITSPTLILHAADDRLQLYHNAEFATATIPGARLVRFDKGGHFLIGVEQTRIRETLGKHILDRFRSGSQ